MIFLTLHISLQIKVPFYRKQSLDLCFGDLLQQVQGGASQSVVSAGSQSQNQGLRVTRRISAVMRWLKRLREGAGK